MNSKCDPMDLEPISIENEYPQFTEMNERLQQPCDVEVGDPWNRQAWNEERENLKKVMSTSYAASNRKTTMEVPQSAKQRKRDPGFSSKHTESGEGGSSIVTTPLIDEICSSFNASSIPKRKKRRGPSTSSTRKNQRPKKVITDAERKDSNHDFSIHPHSSNPGHPSSSHKFKSGCGDEDDSRRRVSCRRDPEEYGRSNHDSNHYFPHPQHPQEITSFSNIPHYDSCIKNDWLSNHGDGRMANPYLQGENAGPNGPSNNHHFRHPQTNSRSSTPHKIDMKPMEVVEVPVPDQQDSLVSDIIQLFDTDEDQTLAPIHKACAHFADNPRLIDTILRRNPNCANIPVKLPQDSWLNKKRLDVQIDSQFFKKNGGRGKEGDDNGIDYFVEDGQYPIHIAVSNNASFEVVQALIKASPHSLSKPDCNGMLPLSLAIRYYRSAANKECMQAILDLILWTCPQATRTTDNRMNTPLHYVCMVSSKRCGQREWMIGGDGVGLGDGVVSGDCDYQHQLQHLSNQSQSSARSHAHGHGHCTHAHGGHDSNDYISMRFLQQLVKINPGAIHQQNFNGLNPLELAQMAGGNSFVCDGMLDLVLKLAYGDDECVDDGFMHTDQTTQKNADPGLST